MWRYSRSRNSRRPIIKRETLLVEVLKPEKHNPTHQILCYYYFDNKLRSKVEVTLYRDITNGAIGSEVYFFHSKEDTQHYRSAHYTNFCKVPSKYIKIISQLNKAMYKIFGSLIK